MIEYKTGDILAEDAEALVNTVNCVGVMGRGIALEFKKAWPENFKAYAAACRRHEVQPGRMFVFETGQLTPPRYIINFPTKRHWRGRSRMEDIEAGLEALVAEVRKRGIRSIAVPPLGAGLGGLDWAQVRTRIEGAMRDLSEVKVVVFEPREVPAAGTSRRAKKIPAMTPGRAALVGLMDRYLGGLLDPFVSLLEVHKLMYFMQEAGEPLRLRLAKGPYGPYAENLRHLLIEIDGYYVSGYGAGDDAPDKPLELVPGAVEDARATLAESPETLSRFERVAKLVEGFESPFGLELLSTVHWVMRHEGATSEEDVIARTSEWGERKRQFSQRQILLARRVLTDQGWLKPGTTLLMTTQSETNTPTTSLEVRKRLVEALKLDLVGPWAGHALAEERLPRRERPSNWYLTGFLIPSGTPPEKSADADEDDDMGGEVPESAGLPEESNEERKAAKKAFFPSSMGLSFLAPQEARSLDVTVLWGDYVQTEIEDPDGETVAVWQRHPRKATVPVALKGADEPVVHNVADSDGLQLHVVERRISAVDLSEHIPKGTRSASVFLVNRRTPIGPDEGEPDLAYVFQPEIEVRSECPFVPRPDLRGARAAEWDEQVADLHYADAPAYATGHGVSAEWEIVDEQCHLLRTAWIPSAEVEKTETVDVPGVELSMEALGTLADGQAAETALRPLVEEYRAWIEARRSEITSLKATRLETAEELLRFAGVAADRIERGIAVLAEDADALDAFRVANRAVARALRQRLPEQFTDQEPRWRAFQLAFLLLNLPGIADPSDPNRETVDLLFFPTGGGKTEAYLGLAAFAMVMRRLRNPGENGLGGAGVSVIMRYTLRLLTLDQLGRAAGLVCALELEREEDLARYGEWPFEIGLWVGKAATPNILGKRGDSRSDSARAKTRQFKSDPRGKPSPIPLENCPWCGTRFQPESFTLLPNDDNPSELRIVCANFECDFTRDRSLPIVAVDEPIYRRLPAFLIATVDKFASLPWVGQAGSLLGGSERYDAAGFYGAAETGKGTRLPAPLPPPDLIIQDELHLISGPLGTMAGLYESAIESLCLREINDNVVKPKIVASTATVRRAQDQIQALFARPLTQIFPPPGPDRRDSYFAQTVPSARAPARLYLGIASQGKNPKVVMRRTVLALMGAAERIYRELGGHKDPENPADPYMSVLGYFNSLRELGGARRILEEEVQNTVKGYGKRKRVGEKQGLFQDRKTFSEVVELTSRVPTNKVAEARRRLGIGFHDIKQRVDCAIATNMISVGLDIQRLGLMVVLGQPKAHSEYIQATSRVGRDDSRPGLVVTLLNIHKPRDRSHYERFKHYHETFYRSVEVGSVTPFSARALDRGLAGALVALSRHFFRELTPPRGAELIKDVRGSVEHHVLKAFLDRVRHQKIEDEDEHEELLRSVQNRVVDLLDSWQTVFEDYRTAGVAMQYQPYEGLKQPRPLLREMLDTDFESEHHAKFRANRSLRDVEPDVNLFLRDYDRRPQREGDR